MEVTEVKVCCQRFESCCHACSPRASHWQARADQATRELAGVREALAIAILWACTSDGGFTELTKQYYDWALAIKEKIPGNPQNKEILDKALRALPPLPIQDADKEKS